MKLSKILCILFMIISTLACNVTHADTCYDPNYNRYYDCSGDEFIGPVVAAILFSAIISNYYDDRYDQRRYDHRHHHDHHHDNRRRHH